MLGTDRRRPFATFGLAAGCLALALLAGCGDGDFGAAGGGGGSTVECTVGGVPLECPEKTTGVDAAGNTFVVGAGTGGAINVTFPGTSAGDFSNDSSDGAQVTYTDANGTVFEASDIVAGTLYTIIVTGYDGERVWGTFTATVEGPGGVTHEITGTFSVAIVGYFDLGDPYEGTYFGIFRVQGQVREGTDPDTGEPIWGSLQTFSFQITIELEHLASAGGSHAYTITHANVNDPFFGCQVSGCTPEFGSSAALPDPPGTMSLAGQGIVVLFPSGAMLVTANSPGELYTSTDGRTLGNALGLDWTWGAVGSSFASYGEAKFGVVYVSLNPDTRSQTWTLTKSAL